MVKKQSCSNKRRKRSHGWCKKRPSAKSKCKKKKVATAAKANKDQNLVVNENSSSSSTIVDLPLEEVPAISAPAEEVKRERVELLFNGTFRRSHPPRPEVIRTRKKGGKKLIKKSFLLKHGPACCCRYCPVRYHYCRSRLIGSTSNSNACFPDKAEN